MSRNLIQRIQWGARRCAVGFGVYAWGSAIVILCIGWAIILVLPAYPKSRTPRKLCRQMCRWLLRMTRLWPSVKGMEHLTTAMQQSREGQFGFLAASNHASYVDALVVAAVCPFDFGFVIKEEAASWPMVGRIIRKCGFLLVNRNEALRAATDGVQIAIELKEGRALHVFPEGTFTPESGLRPFQMGGFKAAVEMKSPILPFVLKGTRSVWRDGTWLPRPGSVEVNIRPLIWPQGQGWAEMVRLRDEVRREILAGCGEQPIEITLAGLPKDE
ncbi:MAG: lysophospholipid acyltransferase family protein [Terriglobia bacterium]